MCARRCLECLAASTLLLVPAGTARAQDARPDPLGCYDVQLGSWSPKIDLNEDTLYVVLPGRIEIRPEEGTLEFEIGRTIIRPAPGFPGTIHGYSHWTPIGTDSLLLTWTTGGYGIRARVGIGEHALTGQAETFWNVRRNKQTAPVTFTRVSCR